MVVKEEICRWWWRYLKGNNFEFKYIGYICIYGKYILGFYCDVCKKNNNNVI